MLSRAVFIVVTLFWVVMNVLLWRAEYGTRAAGAELPVGVVWEKVLTSPDSSSLNILQGGEKVGYCHWTTSVGEEWATVTDENIPSGMPGKIRSYQLRLEGNAQPGGTTNRVRFEFSLRLDAEREWQDLKVRVNVRPLMLHVQSAAAERRVRITVDDGGLPVERVLTFGQLEDPGELVRELLGPVAGELFSQMGVAPPGRSDVSIGSALKWVAREDTMRLGHTQVRVYRVQTRLLDRYVVALVVSRVGEILRVELPGDLVLVNDQLTLF